MTITSFSPTEYQHGGPSTSIEAFGTGIPSNAEILWDGGALTTVVVSSNGDSITSTVPAALIANVGNHHVQVYDLHQVEPAEPVIIIVK